jgi:DNA-binding PadR family transcriptional regulator
MAYVSKESGATCARQILSLLKDAGCTSSAALWRPIEEAGGTDESSEITGGVLECAISQLESQGCLIVGNRHNDQYGGPAYDVTMTDRGRAALADWSSLTFVDVEL